MANIQITWKYEDRMKTSKYQFLEAPFDNRTAFPADIEVKVADSGKYNKSISLVFYFK